MFLGNLRLGKYVLNIFLIYGKHKVPASAVSSKGFNVLCTNNVGTRELYVSTKESTA